MKLKLYEGLLARIELRHTAIALGIFYFVAFAMRTLSIQAGLQVVIDILLFALTLIVFSLYLEKEGGGRKLPTKGPSIPPMPQQPPTTGFTQTEHLPLIPPAEPRGAPARVSRYQYHFSIVPAIARAACAFLLWVLVVCFCIITTLPQSGIVLFFSAVVVAGYSYFIFLSWNGKEFIIDDEGAEYLSTMPGLLPSKSTKISKSLLGAFKVIQSPLDKLIGTCQLHADTPSSGDEVFHNLRWLTHPNELRRAMGLSAPQRNRFLFFIKK